MAVQKCSVAIIGIVLLLSGIILSNANFDPSFINNVFAEELDIPDTKQLKHAKIASTLLQMSNGEQSEDAVAVTSDQDKIRVVMELDALSSENLAELEEYGAEIEVTHGTRVQALVPSYELEKMAEYDFVKYIDQPIELKPNVVSQGVRVIGADHLHEAGNTGQGVKVAVIDLGFDINNPEIAANIVEAIPFRSDGDITGGGNSAHGTAVAEIVVDVAPDVQLFLYNIRFELELLNAIDFIINNGDIDIISMSLGTNVGPEDGTSDIAQAVNNARNNGILFVVSAGNGADSHWQGNFFDPDANNNHNFAIDDETIEFRAQAGDVVTVTLNWDDWPISVQDYDLVILDKNFNLVGFSVNPQCFEDDGDGGMIICPGAPPTESATFVAPVTGIYHVVIVEFHATESVLFDLYTSHPLREYNVPSSSLSIPADASGAFSVGATARGNDRLEDFSSRGPTNDGRIKPDIVAPNGVSTSTINQLFGTSASTPHVAGAAALVKAEVLGASADTLQSLLEQNTANNHPKNNDDGTGRVDVTFLLTLNLPPVANDQTVSIDEDTPVTIILTGSDPDGDSITFSIAADPTNGLLGSIVPIDATSASVTYTPDTDFVGDDSFTFEVNDGSLVDNGTVNINVNPGEPVILSVETSTGTGTATFVTDTGEITNLTSIDPASLPPAPVEFPHGLFDFTMAVNPGDTAIITITFPSDIPAGSQYWKFQNDAYFQLPDELVGSNDGDSVLTLTLTDGELGDADGLANGVIADPGGPVISGGGGIGSIGTGGGSDGGVFRGRTFAFGDPSRSGYDDKPPIIAEVITQEGSMKILAKILDEIGVKDARIIVAKKTIAMQHQSGTTNWWTGTIPSDLLSGETVFFKIVARDYNNNLGEYSGSAEVPFGVLASNEGASFMIKPLSSISKKQDQAYSILASGVKPNTQTINPQITIKNTSTEPLQNIRLVLSPELKGKFLLSDYAIKNIAPQSEAMVSLTLIGRPNVDVMNNPIPYKGQIIISIDNGSPYILELSGEVPNQSSSLQSIFMKMIASKAEDRYKTFEKPDLRISQDLNYEVTLGSGEEEIKNTSDELIIRNTGNEPLKNLHIMTSTAADHFLADQKNIALVPSGSFVKIKLTSMIDDTDLTRDLSGELVIVPENSKPITIPINIAKKLVEDKNTMYEVTTLSGNGVISNTADGIILRNNSNEAIENVRLIIPRELLRVFSVTEDSFTSIEPDSEKIIYLEQRGTLDSNVRQILDDYKGEIIVVSSNGMKKIVPVNIVWKNISSEHFVVYARDNADELNKATQMINFLERGHADAAKMIGESGSKTVVYMTNSLDELKMLNGALEPSAFAHNENVGFVWSNSEDVNMLALREFAHRTIVDDYAAYWTKQKISLDRGNWLVDGISNYVTAKMVGERGMIKDQLNAFVAEPASFEWYGVATDAQYGSSYALFKFLVERYGDAVIDKTLSYLDSTKISDHSCETFEQCTLMMAVYNVNVSNVNDSKHDLSFASIVQEWKDYVLENYGIEITN
ncbi:MAG: subtilisin family serine protease [Candidatus Nitrosomirales archaeon]|jgi:subtilisin family serine protease